MEDGFKFCEKPYVEGPCFNFNDWRKAHFKNRHLYTRLTFHGFHHKICCFLNCYECNIDFCKCVLCDEPCDLFHLMTCTTRFAFDDFPDFLRMVEKL